MNLERIPGWVLWPLTLPYGAAARLRAACYRAGILRRKRLNGVVISVGNLTVGGTGKTPMALWIAERLAEEGKTVAILMRGYRGGTSPEGNTSDESRLLRARLHDRAEIGVGANRFERGRVLEKRGIKWFVLDDGFQHVQLARDVDIVLIDATNPFGGRLLPAGRRREPRPALRRADLIVIARSTHAPAVEAAIRRDSAAPIFYAQTELQSMRKLNVEKGAAVDAGAVISSLRERKLYAFCGIGNPSAFLADLHQWGFQIAGHTSFRDHYRYAQEDIDTLVRAALAAGADALVCTEKDAFNLADTKTNAMDLFFCAISLRVDRGEEFWHAVMATANEKKSSRKSAH